MQDGVMQDEWKGHVLEGAGIRRLLTLWCMTKRARQECTTRVRNDPRLSYHI